MKDQEGQIRIYVACLAAYNNGILHGRWIDADQNISAIQSEVAAMLKASPVMDAEEYAIHDHEGFEGITIAEYQGLESVAELAAFVAEHGALGGALMAYFGDLEEAQEAIEERYAGEYESLAFFAQELTEQTTQIPDSLHFYIDWERMARDMAISDVLAIETGFGCVHVFWNH